jgi:hypothetical protein
MNKPVKELNLAQAEWAPADMADLLTSGFTGVTLARMLDHHFPRATRDEVYMACGLAASLWAADLTIAEMEASMLRRQLGQPSQEAA